MMVWILVLLAHCLPPQATLAQDVFQTLEPCRFNAYAERDDLIIGAVVLNWETGTGCTQNLNSTFPVASVGKLFIADVLYQRVYDGFADFETELTFTSDYLMNGQDDCLGESRLGEKVTLAYLGNIMISCSDNPATWMLMDYLGWDTVNAYVQSLGIGGIGEIIPYSEVDRLKLSLLDPSWLDVPRHLSSQFYRQRSSREAVSAYFSPVPRYSGDDYRRANALYLETFTYNTATPHALALYMQKLRDDLLTGDDRARTVASWIFNTMLLTQRVFSTQYMPADVYVGSKNGFDLGYRAEVNITTRDLQTALPETLSIIIVRHRDIDIPDLQPFRFRNVPTTDLLLTLAPHLANMLYPNASFAVPPVTVRDDRVRRVVLNTDPVLYPCFENYLQYDYLDGLQRCWATIPSVDRTTGNVLFGVGIVLRNLPEAAHMTLVYVLPDGTVRTYQMHRFGRVNTAEAWFEDVSIPGLWRIDVYFDLQPIYTQSLFVG
jgi:beta-lactamase class A